MLFHMSVLQNHWIQLSVREVSAQCKLALDAWADLERETVGGAYGVFGRVHSFLAHAAILSKLIKASDIEDTGITNVLGKELLIPLNSAIHDRRLRNNLEHYDEELKKWIKTKGIMANIGTYNLGPKNSLAIPDLVYVTHYDPGTRIFTFVDEDFDLVSIAQEISHIQSCAEKWMVDNHLMPSWPTSVKPPLERLSSLLQSRVPNPPVEP